MKLHGVITLYDRGLDETIHRYRTTIKQSHLFDDILSKSMGLDVAEQRNRVGFSEQNE